MPREPAALADAQRFPTAEALADALARRVAEIITYAAGARGRASLIVSGGRTPVTVFQRLAATELPWEKVGISLADERRVPESDPRSNARLVREHLLQGPAAAARFAPLHREGTGERADEAACAAALGTLPRPFDAVILGMGADGHIASLFPGAPELPAALTAGSATRCQAITAPADPPERLTLTLATLLDSRWIALHVTSREKWETLATALTEDDPERYPVAALFRQRRVPVHVYWSP